MTYKTAGYEAAKEFAEEITESMDMIKRFFTVKPSDFDINTELEFDGSIMTKLTLQEDFINGYRCTFIFDNDSGAVLSFKATEEIIH